MNEAAVPEIALVRDENGIGVDLKIEDFDMSLNFINQNTVQGKPVSANKFVMLEETDSNKDVVLGSWVQQPVHRQRKTR